MAVKTIAVSEVRQKLKALLVTLEQTGEPYCITQHDCPKAVLVRYEDYQILVGQTGQGHPYVVHRPTVGGGEPTIRGSRITVRHIVERTQAGQSVEEILTALPHLTAAHVYDALSYYYDHQPEVDQVIEESRSEHVSAKHGLKIEKVADGVAVVHAQTGRW